VWGLLLGLAIGLERPTYGAWGVNLSISGVGVVFYEGLGTADTSLAGDFSVLVAADAGDVQGADIFDRRASTGSRGERIRSLVTVVTAVTSCRAATTVSVGITLRRLRAILGEDRRGRPGGRGGLPEGHPGGERRPGVRPGGAKGRGGREGGQVVNVEEVYAVTYAEPLGGRRSTGPRPVWWVNISYLWPV
jgi:hypothetical protein